MLTRGLFRACRCRSQSRCLSTTVSPGQSYPPQTDDPQPQEFAPRKAVVLKKITRYEYEKQLCHPSNEDELQRYLSLKGSDYRGLVKRHDEYYASLDNIVESLSKKGISTTVVHRLDYRDDLIQDADTVISAGGDGTYLLAASKVRDCSKPIIGVNTDPLRSEGYLCLPKKFSSHFDAALENLQAGKFKWSYRQRLRITLSGKHDNDEPIHLHDQELGSPEHRFSEHVQEHEMYTQSSLVSKDRPPRVLPFLALNDVFVGESLSARVSYYELSVNDSPRVKQKSSGVTVCTGTGSSSWFFHINQIPKQSIQEVLKIANRLGNANINVKNEVLLRRITQAFNCSLKFDPTDLRMAYTIRDPVVNGIFQVANPRGFANRLVIKSRMWDAHIVIDGGYSFRFNDGAVADIDMYPEDALKTVMLE